jgi:hypothetical protein
MIIAQGKTAEVAALGNAHPVPTLPFFWFGAPAGWRAKPEKGEQIIFRSEPRAALVPRWPWATIISSLQDFSLVRSARIVGERSGPRPPCCLRLLSVEIIVEPWG